MDNLVRKSVKLTVLLVLAAVIVLIFTRQWRFASGILVSSVWSATNFLLLIKILEIALLYKKRENLALILLIKFPLLYLIGFLILASKLFPVYSLFAGSGSILLATGVISVWPKRI